MAKTILEKGELIKKICLEMEGINPIANALRLMKEADNNMHGPEHHILDGASFLVAMHNAGVTFDLEEALNEMIVRGSKMPGATCGQWGVCGSASSLGAALSIIHKTGPLSNNSYYQDNLRLTSKILGQIAEIGGPRCCKRNAYIALLCAIDFVEENYDIHLEKMPITCSYYDKNSQCLKEVCPFYPQNNEDIIIRKITIQDYPSASKELQAAFKGEPWNEDWSYIDAYQRISQIMSAPVSRGYVAISNGEVVGMLCGRIMTYLDEQLLMIDEFSIHPQCQGQHLGQRLMTYVKEEMAKIGIEHLSLMTERGFPCVKFYESQGFEQEEHSVIMTKNK